MLLRIYLSATVLHQALLKKRGNAKIKDLQKSFHIILSPIFTITLQVFWVCVEGKPIACQVVVVSHRGNLF